MSDVIAVPGFITVTLGFAVFLIGAQINARVEVLRRFSIPEPVTGGLLAALVILAVYLATGREVDFDMERRDYFLVLFFASIGFNARFQDLIAGGKPLALLLVLTLLTILAQNLIGGVGAALFGYPVQAGVLMGSAALIGGHGTAVAWGPEVAAATGLDGATELGVAMATLGLVLAALAGGPVANYLIKRKNLTPSHPEEGPSVGLPYEDGTPTEDIDHITLMRVLLYLNIAIVAGYYANQAIGNAGLKLPLFVPCLILGIVICNLRDVIAPKSAPISRTPSLALVSEFSLGAFLAMSLMGMQLWTISSLGLAIAFIMLLQTLFAVVFVIFILFPVLGGGYRAAVLAAGFAGFSLGATPTAIANMTAVTKRYGPSPIAFVVLPLVSAFFVDIANAIVIQAIVNF
jgi:ESS family glutamate:Na+ symporter